MSDDEVIERDQGAKFEKNLFSKQTAVGFSSPAADYLSPSLDLYGYLVRDQLATDYFRVASDDLKKANIVKGDILIVDRGVDPQHGSIVIVSVDSSDFIARRLDLSEKSFVLRAENDDIAPIIVKDGIEVSIFGVVVGQVRKFR